MLVVPLDEIVSAVQYEVPLKTAFEYASPAGRPESVHTHAIWCWGRPNTHPTNTPRTVLQRRDELQVPRVLAGLHAERVLRAVVPAQQRVLARHLLVAAPAGG